MAKVHGAITAIQSEPRNTKYGSRNVHYIHVNGERFQLGFGKLEVKVGDVVDFDSGDKGYGPEVTKGSLVVVSSGVVGPVVPIVAGVSLTPAMADSPAPAPKSGGKAPTPFPIPALHGDRAIVRQNALTQARGLVEASMPKETRSLADLEALAHVIVKLAPIFEAYSAGDNDMAAAKADMEKK